MRARLLVRGCSAVGAIQAQRATHRRHSPAHRARPTAHRPPRTAHRAQPSAVPWRWSAVVGGARRCLAVLGGASAVVGEAYVCARDVRHSVSGSAC